MNSPKTFFLPLLALCLTTSLAFSEDKPVAAGTPASASAPAPAQTKIQNVTPDQAEQLLKTNKNIVVLDVRSPAEFQGGHIAGAQNLDYFSADFKEKLAALDRSKTYLVHCAAGTRSGKACSLMEQQANFGEVYHLNGGMKAWESAGKPVYK